MKFDRSKQLINRIVFLTMVFIQIQSNAIALNLSKKHLNDGPHVLFADGKTEILSVKSGKRIFKICKAKPDSIMLNIPLLKKSFSIKIRPLSIFPDTYQQVKDLFILSDVHGDFLQFYSLLLNHGIINENLDWTFGKGHLVILGDVFDRGDMVTEILWILYHLEAAADQNGGKLHYILGNHEIMILQNNLKYIHEKYRKICRKILKIPYNKLFSSDSLLGQWLRSKHTIMQINDLLLVHAGIHPEFIQRNISIGQVNQLIRENLDENQNKINTHELINFLFGRNGPLWYRGFIPKAYLSEKSNYSPIPEDEVNKLLNYFSVKHIIIGHTSVYDITPLFNQQVIAIESGIHEGHPGEALIIKNNKFYRAMINGDQFPL
jgi:hypothetical protein